MSDENSWEPTRTPMAEVAGLATINDPGTRVSSGSEITSSTVSFAMKPSEAAKLEDLEIGDHLEVAGLTFVVQKIDLRGVLPTAYSSKIVGYLR